MKVEVGMLTLDNVDFKVESIKWDKRKLFDIDKSYDYENKVAKNFHVSNNTIFKYIKQKLAGKYKVKSGQKQSYHDIF